MEWDRFVEQQDILYRKKLSGLQSCLASQLDQIEGFHQVAQNL